MHIFTLHKVLTPILFIDIKRDFGKGDDGYILKREVGCISMLDSFPEVEWDTWCSGRCTLYIQNMSTCFTCFKGHR